MTALTAEIKEFIRRHAQSSPESVALNAKKYPDLPIPFIAQQLKGRRKAEKKLPTWFENEDVVYPPSLSLEQCTSERVARFKAALVTGKSAADLTGGFGVDARFLAESFDSLHYIEQDPNLAAIAKENFTVFGLGQKVDTMVADGAQWISEYECKLDLAYVDPARRDARSLKVSGLEECAPNLVALWETLLEKADVAMVKLSPGLDFDYAVGALSHVKSGYVISLNGECKEMLLIAEKGHAAEPKLHCVHLRNETDDHEFAFYRSEERSAQTEYSAYKKYLYEPNASIMKAGAFKSLGNALGLPSLSQRTRFYTSDTLQADFPGRIFEVLAAGDISARTARQWFPKKRANVLARNCGSTTQELRAQLKLKEGGEEFAVGCRDGNGFVLLRCRRV